MDRARHELRTVVAPGLPLPCFSRYGSGADTVEARLIGVR